MRGPSGDRGAMNRIFQRVTCLGVLSVVAAACGGGRAQQPRPTDPTTIATGGPGASAPGHVFQPQAHPPHTHPQPPAPPDLGRLPPLVNDVNRCFASAEAVMAAPPPPPGRPFLRGSGGGVKSAPARASAGGVGLSGMGSGAGAAAPPSAPPAAAQPAYGPPMTASAPAADAAPGRPSRAEKKEARKDARSKQAEAPAAAPAEMAAPEAEATDDVQVATGDAEQPQDEYHDWGQALYLSNDDTMSLSSAQRVIYAIDNFLPLPPEHIRPHELLNYFSFDVAEVAETSDFSVLPGILPKPHEPGNYSLALAVRGWPLDTASRRNAQLSFVVDRSGSMSAEGRMEYLKRGLLQATDQLKRGDIVHLTIFDHRVCTPLKNFVVGRDDMAVLTDAIHRLRPEGSTDLHAGLRTGYDIADAAYQPTYTNRVVMISDALANTGVTDESLISIVGQYYDSRKIRLSGVGVGTEFNDELLDKLTERGRGAYVFLGSEAEVDAVFGNRFISLIETTANDVHFRLHLPPSLRMNVFYGEESSVYKEDVQAIHYFANTSQLFLQDLMAKGGTLKENDQIMLTIEYEHPETGAEQVEEYAFTLGQMQAGQRNVMKGLVLMRFIDGLAWMSQRQYQGPGGYYGQRGEAGSWSDPEAWGECQRGRGQLEEMSREITDDPEVRRVLGLWDKYCSRFERTRTPVRRQPGQPDAWPGASD